MSVEVGIRKVYTSCPFDDLVALSTFSTFVHTEVIIKNPEKTAYAAYGDKKPCFEAALHPVRSKYDWVFVPIPIKEPGVNVERAQEFLKDILKARLPYRFPWLVMAPQWVLHDVEIDLDCEKLDTWGSVFCSQATLLFLCRCAINNLLDIKDTSPLFQYDSNGASPAYIQSLLAQLGLT